MGKQILGHHVHSLPFTHQAGGAQVHALGFQDVDTQVPALSFQDAGVMLMSLSLWL